MIRVVGIRAFGSLLSLFCLITSVGASFPENAPPDIILIVADNLGHGDLGCYGCQDIKTPNIDSIATDGVRLTNFYSNGPECSPTRTALLTGRYSNEFPDWNAHSARAMWDVTTTRSTWRKSTSLVCHLKNPF